MALDAATLALVAAELKRDLCDVRIDKITQPARDEVLLALRSRTRGFRLLLVARSGSARVCLTEETFENPAVPPSFCMLLRKHLSGGRLLDVYTPPGERILFFDFLCTNEMGDLVHNTLAAELMGRYCNLVLIAYGAADATAAAVANRSAGVNPDAKPGKIVDALKRVDYDASDVRQLLPGLPYTLPPRQGRADFLTVSFATLRTGLQTLPVAPAPALQKLLAGVGPVVLREAAFRAFGAEEKPADTLTTAELAALEGAVEAIQADYAAGGVPTLVRTAEGAPVEFSFTPLYQYLPACVLEEYPSFSTLLEGYYAQKDKVERLRQKSKDLRRTVQNLYERAVRKQAARTEELAQSRQSDHLRVWGEVLTANLHAIPKGGKAVTLMNWYDGEEVTIPLDARLSASANAQRYFKEYKKKQTAVRMLAELLAAGEKEIEYLGTVLYEVDEAGGEEALGEVRAELKGAGYLKHYKQRNKKQKPAECWRYTSSDGFLILVGRNNTQNEKITLKTARGKDLWFHVKNAPGSHVVVMSEGRDIPPATKNEAALLAVLHSSQRNGAKVPVDYTPVKNVRKTGDLPPGLVLYDHYETAYITPAAEDTQKLEAQREK